VESRCLPELARGLREVPIDRTVVEADRRRNLARALARREKQNDPLFDERQLGNRHCTPFVADLTSVRSPANTAVTLG